MPKILRKRKKFEQEEEEEEEVEEKVEEKVEEGSKKIESNFTIKSRLHAQSDQIHDWILHGVDTVTSCAIHVTRFANMYLLHCVDNHLQLPIIDKPFFDRIICLITVDAEENRKKFADPQMRASFEQIYKPLLPKDFAIDRNSRDRTFLQRLGLDLQTNSRVYLRTQFLRRFRDWCKQCLYEIIPIDMSGKKSDERSEKMKQRWKLVTFLFQETACSASVVVDVALIKEDVLKLQETCSMVMSDEVALKLAEKIAETRQILSGTVDYTKTKTKIVNGETVIETVENKVLCRPITHRKLLNVDFSPFYLIWLVKRLKQIEKYNEEIGENGKQKKVYSILPISSLDRRYVSIENTALIAFIHSNRHDEEAVGKEIFAKMKENDCSNLKKTTNLFSENELWFWQQCFKFKANIGENRHFKCYMSTDGVGCSALYKKSAKKLEKEVEKEDDEKGSNELITIGDETETNKRIRVFSKEELAESDIIAFDPGQAQLFTSVIDGPENEKNHVESYSPAKWLQLCGGAKAKKKREKWVKSVQGYEKWLLEMPSCKVGTVAAMQKHVTHLFAFLEKHLVENGRERVRRLRFTRYVTNQKALSSIVNDVVNKPKKAIQSTKKKTIVVYGDGKFQTRGPMRKVYRELRRKENVTVVDMDEFRTSKLTTCCAFPKQRICEGKNKVEAKAVEREGPVGEYYDKKGEFQRKSLYSVTFCQNCSCIWNRDVNAALNMMRLFHYAQENRGARHLFFKRENAGVDASADASVDAKESKVIPEKKKKRNDAKEKTVKSKADLGERQALPVCKSSSNPEVGKKKGVQN